MRIMLDTNVVISVIVFQSQVMLEMMELILSRHRLVLSSYVIDELKQVVDRKFAGKAEALDAFLTALPYELVYTPRVIRTEEFSIRDPDDYPVLYSAVIEDVDVLITGDKDFADVDIEKPEIMTPAQFVEKYRF